MFYFLSKTLDLAVAPLIWIAFLIFIARPRRRRARGFRRAAPWIAIAMLYTLSIEPVANVLERSLERSAANTTKNDVTYDAAILLGGVVNDAGMDAFGGAPPSYNDNIERLLVTYDLLRTNRARFAILSGGTGGIVQTSDVSEAQVLAEQLYAWGIDRDRIIVEGKARNTRENAVFSEELVRSRGFEKIVIITSAFHMQRASGCFRRVGLTFDTLPVDWRAYDSARRSGSFLPHADQFMMSSHAIREWVGRAVYSARGFT